LFCGSDLARIFADFQTMPQLAHPSQTPIDRTRLDAVVDPIARAHGAEVVDLEFKSEPGGWVLRVFVEKLGSADANADTRDAAVDLDLCSGVARDLSPALDVADIIPHRYHLEISSPGVERPLRKERDFLRFTGKKARLKLTTATASSHGEKVVVGVLAGVEAGKVKVIDGHREHVILLDQIATARLVFEFGPAPKPGKQKKQTNSVSHKSDKK
jgi:ribosome maturation factor RimP